MENNVFDKVMPRTVSQYKNIAERYVTGKMWAHQEPLNNSP